MKYEEMEKAELIELLEKKTKEIENLKERCFFDSLTGVYNRLYFEEELQMQLEYFKRRGKNPLLLAFLDVDNLKSVNDVYGHDTGDEVLLLTVELIRNFLRKTDILARWGGDEFVVLAFGDEKKIKERLVDACQKVENLFFERFPNLSVGLSFGIVVAHSQDTIKTMTKSADEKMYRRKNLKREERQKIMKMR